jgi:hypothetical protein
MSCSIQLLLNEENIDIHPGSDTCCEESQSSVFSSSFEDDKKLQSKLRKQELNRLNYLKLKNNPVWQEQMRQKRAAKKESQPRIVSHELTPRPAMQIPMAPYVYYLNSSQYSPDPEYKLIQDRLKKLELELGSEKWHRQKLLKENYDLTKRIAYLEWMIQNHTNPLIKIAK